MMLGNMGGLCKSISIELWAVIIVMMGIKIVISIMGIKICLIVMIL